MSAPDDGSAVMRHDWHSQSYVEEWIARDLQRDEERRTRLRKMLSVATFPPDAEISVLDADRFPPKNRSTGNFDPSTYHDRYQEALQQLIEAKMERGAIEPRTVSTLSPVIDSNAAIAHPGASGHRPEIVALAAMLTARTEQLHIAGRSIDALVDGGVPAGQQLDLRMRDHPVLAAEIGGQKARP